MERKFLITSIFITLGVIAFLSGYLLMPEIGLNIQTGVLMDRFSGEIKVRPDSSEVTTSETLPLSSGKFISFVNPLTDSKKIVAVNNKGEVVEVDIDALQEKVIYTSQTDVVEVWLSPTGDSALYSFYDKANGKKYAYIDLKNGELSEIAGDVRSAAFSPRGDRLAVFTNKESGGELLLLKAGNITKRVLKTRIGAAIIAWPADDFISLISYDKSGYGDLFTLTLDSTLNKVLSYQYDLNIKWSPSGEKIIFSEKDENGSVHTFYKDIKSNSKEISLDTEVGASKCIWADEESVICGITSQTQVKDGFYKVAITDGSKTLVVTPNINLLTKELALSRSGDTLFVLNDIDGKLYALKLKSN